MSVLKIAPDFAQRSEVLYRLAVVFGKSYQLDQAINYFKLATLESIDVPTIKRKMDILIKMGICYIEKKEYVEALRSFESALLLNNQDFRVLQHIAWCEFLLKRNSQALDQINKAIALKDSDGDNFYIKARILLEMEDYQNANDNLKKAIICNISKVEYLSSLAILNALNKEYKEAFDNFLRATQLAPNCPEIWYDIGLLYETHQQYKEALTAYQKTTEIDPSFNEAIVRKQILNNQVPPKSPTPHYVHPEFHVADSMVPLKSFLANLKVKKAAEPCFDSSTAVQPSVIIKSIFSHNAQANPCLLPVPSSDSGLFPASKSAEEVKVPPEETKFIGSCEMDFALPEKQANKGKVKGESKGTEGECLSSRVPIVQSDPSNVFQPNPLMVIDKPVTQPPPAETLQTQPPPSMSNSLQSQQMDLLKTYVQFREHQLHFENMLRSYGITLPSTDNPQASAEKPLPSHETNPSLISVGRMPEGSSMFKEYNPQLAQSHNPPTLPQINFGTSNAPIRPVPFYGIASHPQYEGRAEGREECVGTKKAVPQSTGLLRPIPMIPFISGMDGHMKVPLDNKGRPEARNGQEGGSSEDLKGNIMVKPNVPSQMSDVKYHKKDKGRELEYGDVQKKRARKE
jgi:tetratricopeptide (TPR) repeat protein